MVTVVILCFAPISTTHQDPGSLRVIEHCLQSEARLPSVVSKENGLDAMVEFFELIHNELSMNSLNFMTKKGFDPRISSVEDQCANHYASASLLL